MTESSQLKHFIAIADHDPQFLTGLIDQALADKELFRAGTTLAM